ncbi:MAG: chemotaxis protein [Sphingomonadaceae bacterium]|nr:chemotaxis protein [Sphingomonadaceae bacterium]
MTDEHMFSEAMASARLGETAVAARLAAYNPDGQLERDLRTVWARAEHSIMAHARKHWQAMLRAVPRVPGRHFDADFLLTHTLESMRDTFVEPVDRNWVLAIANRGTEFYQMRLLQQTLVVTTCAVFSDVIADVAQAYRDEDPGFVLLCIETLHRLQLIETEIMQTQISAIRRAETAVTRGTEGSAFRNEISGILSNAVADSAGLRSQTSEASASARGMLGKASEVAAAAEQSAVAMREAAQTAAGLIRAIEDTRSEVEIAAGVATRAAEQSAHALDITEALSGHAQAIESILGLIRDIAGQTNLLALNATIEAARAGDAGRGFAVVAQEVKSLASQTARATDDIAAKISAIQSATRQTLDANGSIRDIVGEVQSSAQRIRETMEAQAQTVTMITAAVDETALAADSMSGTIASIRSDTENVASDIDELGEGFRAVDTQLAKLETVTSEFVAKVSQLAA